jgi:hypothetical protein
MAQAAVPLTSPATPPCNEVAKTKVMTTVGKAELAKS